MLQFDVFEGLRSNVKTFSTMCDKIQIPNLAVGSYGLWPRNNRD